MREKAARAGAATLAVTAVAWLASSLNEPFLLSLNLALNGSYGAWWGLLSACLALLLSIILVVLSESAYKRWSPRLLGVLVALQLAGAARLDQGLLDPDEPAHLHWLWLLSEGSVPYRDFFVVRHMLWHYMCVPLVWLFPDLSLVRASKLLMFGVLLVILLVAALLARELGAQPILVVVLLLSVTNFVYASVQFRSDPPALVLALLAVLAYARGRPALAGVSIGLSIWMTQKVLALAAGLFAGALLSSLLEPGVGLWPRLRPVALYSLAAGGTVGLYVALMAAAGMLQDYYTCCILSASIIARHFMAQPLLHSNAMMQFRLAFEASPVLLVTCAVGTLAMLASSKKGCRVAALTGLAATGSIFTTRLGFGHYSLFAVAFGCLGGAYLLGKLPSWPGQPLTARLPQVFCAWVGALSLFWWAAFPPLGIDLSGMQLSLSNTAPGETFCGEGNTGNLHNPVFRPSATYYGIGAEEIGNWSRDLKVDLPKGNPLDFDLLLKAAPKVMVLTGEARRREAVKRFAERGIHYRQISPVSWKREP